MYNCTYLCTQPRTHATRYIHFDIHLRGYRTRVQARAEAKNKQFWDKKQFTSTTLLPFTSSEYAMSFDFSVFACHSRLQFLIFEQLNVCLSAAFLLLNALSLTQLHTFMCTRARVCVRIRIYALLTTFFSHAHCLFSPAFNFSVDKFSWRSVSQRC